MRHLRIKLVGHLNIARPAWPTHPRTLWHDEVSMHHESEPIVQVEIDKRTWDAMFDLYETYMKTIDHPAVRDAWLQYQTVRKLVGKQE